MSKKTSKLEIGEDEGLCVKHGKVVKKSNFYKASDSSVYSGIGFIPICKKCIIKEIDKYLDIYDGDTHKAVYYTCRLLDVAFNNSAYESAIKSAKSDNVFGNYMRFYNSLGSENGTDTCFDNGEGISDTNANANTDLNVDISGDQDVKMTEKDKEVRKDVIDLLEYDPFEGYSISDQKFLYSDLINYFGDEDIIEDQFLVSQIIQIVNNNNQIRKIDYIISKITASVDLLMENESRVKALNATKKDIVQNNDKIAKENGISVNKRKDSNIKKSTLTATMEYLRSLNFEDAEIDYYDQKKAYGMQATADISIKAIQEQLQFDENDIKEILDMQRNMIKEMEEKILDLEEESRKLHIKIAK